MMQTGDLDNPVHCLNVKYYNENNRLKHIKPKQK